MGVNSGGKSWPSENPHFLRNPEIVGVTPNFSIVGLILFGDFINFEKIFKKFLKNFRILGVVTDLQIDFLNEPQLSSTFCGLILIEPAKGFNLRHMRVLESLGLKRYYVITKKLRQNRKFRSKK